MTWRRRYLSFALLAVSVFALVGCFKADIKPNIDIDGFSSDGPKEPRSEVTKTLSARFRNAYAAAKATARAQGGDVDEDKTKEDDGRQEAEIKGNTGDGNRVEIKIEEQDDRRRVKVRVKVKGSRTLAHDVMNDLESRL